MVDGKPKRRGFGFYIVFSILLHLVLLVLLVPDDWLAVQEPPPESLPVRLYQRETPDQQLSLRHQVETLDLPADVAWKSARVDRVRGTTKLSYEIQPLAKSPGEVSRAGLIARLSKFDFPPLLAEVYQPVTTPELPSVTEVAGEELNRVPVELEQLEIQPLEIDREPLEGMSRAPRLSARPTFPYSGVQHLLLESETEVSYSLLVNPRGFVREVELVDSSGNSQLDLKLKEWVRNWRYTRSDAEHQLTVTVAVPGR